MGTITDLFDADESVLLTDSISIGGFTPMFYYRNPGQRKPSSGVPDNKVEPCKTHPLLKINIETSYSGSLELAKIQINNDQEITIISMYGLESVGKTKYAITSLHRMLSDLTGILNGHIGGKQKIILGGDLNASVQIDNYYGGHAHEILFERIADFNLFNCFSPYYDDFVQTHRHFRSSRPWQNDYLFISNSLKRYLKSCVVIDNEEIRKYSDHNPVVIELEI